MICWNWLSVISEAGNLGRIQTRQVNCWIAEINMAEVAADSADIDHVTSTTQSGRPQRKATEKYAGGCSKSAAIKPIDISLYDAFRRKCNEDEVFIQSLYYVQLPV